MKQGEVTLHFKQVLILQAVDDKPSSGLFFGVGNVDELETKGV